MRARAVPGSLCWAGAAWGGQGAAPLAPAPLQVLCPQGGLGGRGFVQDRWKTRGLLLVVAVPETCPAPGQDRPQHWSSSEQPGPCAQPTPRAKAAPAWGKMLPSCPTNPAFPWPVSLSHRRKGTTSRAASHSMGTSSLAEVTQLVPSPPPQPRLDPAPHQLMSRPGTPSHAAAPTVLPPSSARPQGHCPGPLQATDPELREGTLPTDRTEGK